MPAKAKSTIYYVNMLDPAKPEERQVIEAVYYVMPPKPEGTAEKLRKLDKLEIQLQTVLADVEAIKGTAEDSSARAGCDPRHWSTNRSTTRKLMADFEPPDCYVPPDCEEPGKQHYASVHVHIDVTAYPNQPAIVFLCESHFRRRVAVLRSARIAFEHFRL